MIAKIEIVNQYGKLGKTAVYPISELDDAPETVSAHSVQGALTWANKSYHSAIVDDLGDGRFLLTTPWQERDKSMDILFDNNAPIKQADYTRIKIMISPVNTIHESTGY